MFNNLSRVEINVSNIKDLCCHCTFMEWKIDSLLIERKSIRCYQRRKKERQVA